MKIISTTIILSLFLAFFSSCTQKGLKEKEPNNTFATANEIEPDTRILGYMDTPNDMDFYLMHVKRRGIIDIQLSGVKGINLAFKIWKGADDPKLIKWVDDNRKSSPERFTNLSVVPGVYYIEILQSDRDPRKADKESSYELQLTGRAAISEESEPNDSMDRADTAYPEKEITGYFSPAYNRMNESPDNLHREEDWYAVDVSLKSDAAELMDISLSGVSGVNSVLYLYDSDNKVIAMSDNGGPGEPETITGAGIKKSGTYYVVAASKSYTANHEEPYTLKVTMSQHDSGSEMEPNNDFASANVINNNIITGKINSKDDRDLFIYNLTGGTSILRIELRPPDDMDAILSLYSIDKEKIIVINSGGRGKKEVYPNFFTEKDFYIIVTAKTGDILPKSEYVLTVSPFKELENQEREPNNETSQANKFTGRTMSGFTSFKGDKDYFLIAYDSRINEKFEVMGPKSGAIKVSITDPLGYITKSVDVQGDRKMVFSEMIDKKGYIIIEAITENYDNPYTINLRGNK